MKKRMKQMKFDKLLGNIIRIPLWIALTIGFPVIYIIGLGIYGSFKETNEIIKEIFTFGGR
jgi:hypothetical protein